jgi:hypothetical protein
VLNGTGWLKTRPNLFIPGREIRYSWYRRLVGPQGLSERMQKISRGRVVSNFIPSISLPLHLEICLPFEKAENPKFLKCFYPTGISACKITNFM